ncbi:hypothetical protein PENTCL1PPCAC_27275 [Pristionchus entomophagus]|uniref:MARVEL domain-containing protein n=1 Tax=Pristionchus entomophagus TaxID=358040 RepID=A0AAV5UDP2_9BILA|nr:hypothetical protein PENTCL1PPCAC_27275 [Pristionchus entomophagus]
MFEQKCCFVGTSLLVVFSALTLFGVFNSEHKACCRPASLSLLDKLLAVTTLFIISPLIITVLISRRYYCLLPLVRFLLYFYAIVSIFRLGALTGTSGSSLAGCTLVSIFSVVCIIVSGCLIGGVTYVVDELQEMQRMNYWTDSSI